MFRADKFTCAMIATWLGGMILLSACVAPVAVLLGGESFDAFMQDDFMWKVSLVEFCFGVLFFPLGIWGLVVNRSSCPNKGGFGRGLLGWFAAPLGLILYLVLRKEKPKAAKAYGIGALIYVVYCIIFTPFLGFLINLYNK